MGHNKHLRDVIAGLERSIQLHEQKIMKELQKAYPNWPRIDCWRKQIRGFESRRDRLIDRFHGRYKA